MKAQFNIKADSAIETSEAIALTIRTGKPVYMLENGKLTTRKPTAAAVKILEPFDLMARGVEFRKFSAEEDHIGEQGGWGFTYQGETLCFGYDQSDKEYAAQFIAIDLDDHLFDDIHRRMNEIHDMLMQISIHSYDGNLDDWECGTEQIDIPAILAELA